MLRRLSVSAAALLAGLGAASAQQPPVTGGSNVPSLNNDQAKPMQNGAEEPGVHPAAPANTNAFVDGKLNVPGAPTDSQTVPSKFSERNAKLDATPIMALSLGLSDEQRQRIVAGAANAPVSLIEAKLADVLPATAPVLEFSPEVKAAAPMTSDLQYIRTKDKILLVRGPNMVVTGEIALN